MLLFSWLKMIQLVIFFAFGETESRLAKPSVVCLSCSERGNHCFGAQQIADLVCLSKCGVLGYQGHL